MTPANFRCKPSCEPAGCALLTVLWAGFLYWHFYLHPEFQQYNCVPDKPTFHTNPKTRILTDLTEVNSLFYPAIKHLLYAGSLDIGHWK